MPKTAVRSRRSVATIASSAMVGASVAVLLVSPMTVPTAGAVAAPGSTQRASVVNQTNAQSDDGGDNSVLSADGNSVAFTSFGRLENLDPNGHNNVYVRDLVRQRTVMISRGQFTRPSTSSSSSSPPIIVKYGPEKLLDLNGARANQAQQPEIKDTPPDGPSFSPSISADGRFVAFTTLAENMFLEDNDSDSEIVVVDRDPDGDADYDEDKPNGSRDYRYIRVTRDDSYWYPGTPKLAENAARIVWVQGEGRSELKTSALNLVAGEVGPIEPVPAELGEDIRLVEQFDPAISGDGNHIAMHAIYTIPCSSCDAPSFGIGGGDFHAIISTDTRTGTATRVDFDFGEPVSNDFTEFVMRPTISFDGTVIAFEAEEFYYNYDGKEWESRFDEPNIYVVQVDYAAPSGEQITDTKLASRNNAGDLVNGVTPTLSSDGRYLAFVTDALASHDGEDGQRVDRSCINFPRFNPDGGVGMGGEPMLQFSAALPPQRDHPRTHCQVVVRDLILDRDRLRAEQPRLPGTLASPNQAGNAGNDDTIPHRLDNSPPSLTFDGGRIAYDSEAFDLVPGDTNRHDDVFVRTLEPTLQGNAVEFGPVEIGQNVVRTAQLDQVGAGPLVVEQVTAGGANAGDFTVGAQTCQGQPLHQTGSCLVSVQFAPTATGARNGQLAIRVRGGRVFIVDLRGTGTEVPPPPRGPEFSAGPNPVDFGERLLLSSGPESIVTVTNRGGSPLRINSVLPVGPSAPGDYSIGVNTCFGVDVAPNGQCEVAVRFSPTLPGDRPAVLQFNDNALGGPHLISLRGKGSQPQIEVNPGVTPPGRVATVTGKGFPPGKKVIVTFRDRPGSTTATAGQDGTFRASLLVFHKAAPETRFVVATVDGIPALAAEGRLLIVFPTVSPADFVVRG